MKKRSLVAMGLAGVMTIGMCVPVLANPIGPGDCSVWWSLFVNVGFKFLF